MKITKNMMMTVTIKAVYENNDDNNYDANINDHKNNDDYYYDVEKDFSDDGDGVMILVTVMTMVIITVNDHKNNGDDNYGEGDINGDDDNWMW